MGHERTSARATAMCAFPSLAIRPRTSPGSALLPNVAFSFDHLVGALLQRQGHLEAEGLGSLEVHHELKLDWLFDRQVVRLRTLENLVDEDGGPTE